jgi:HlyD family secretion protein
MNRISLWIKRHWLVLAIAAGGILVVAGASFLGYRTRQAWQAAAVAPPPTVAVNRGDVVLSVTAPGLSISTNTRVLSSRVESSVDEILVKPGEAVQAGQTLARLGERERFTSAVGAARMAVLQARQAVEDLQASAPQASAQARQAVEAARQALDSLNHTAAEQSSQAQLALAQAQAALELAQRNRDKMNYPHSSNPLVLEKAETDYLLARQAYKEALGKFNKVARKKLTDPDRVQALDQLLAAEQNMQAKLAIYNWYLLGYTEDDIAHADAELAVARTTLEKAQADWERLKDGPSPAASALAEAALADAQRQWERAEGGSEPIALEIARAALAQAQSDLAKAQADLAGLQIRAPFAGIVLNVAVQAGQTVSPGTALATLLDPKTIQVRATVVEEDLPLVQPGQPVELFFDALPDANVTGTLDRIVPQRDSDTQAIYPVFITLDQVPERLAAGMTADASIVIAETANVLRLPRAVVHARSDGTADVAVWSNGQVEYRTIQVGLRGDSFVEIKGGLAEGEAVVAQ